MGCDGADNAQIYYIGDYTGASIAIAVQDHTPDILTAHFEIAVDDEIQLLEFGVGKVHTNRGDKVIYSGSVTKGGPIERVELDLTGQQMMFVRMWTDDQCTSASKGYGALVQSFVY